MRTGGCATAAFSRARQGSATAPEIIARAMAPAPAGDVPHVRSLHEFPPRLRAGPLGHRARRFQARRLCGVQAVMDCIVCPELPLYDGQEIGVDVFAPSWVCIGRVARIDRRPRTIAFPIV